MPLSRLTIFPLLFVAVSALAQKNDAPLVQPGAPGTESRTLASAASIPRPHPLTSADIYFMQGMIHHHSQAVEMTALMGARTHNRALLSLGYRISISQTDEIDFMKRWLQERGQAITMPHDMSSMPPMDHSKMDHSKMAMEPAPMLMPGMLTPAQMRDLANAKGNKFDRLFLTGMMQHHTGALTMVDDLFAVPDAGQDTVLYDFATDIDNTQRAEIGIMKSMLAKEKK